MKGANELMANEQGTGKHPHKSTEEPYPHHKGSGEEGQKMCGGSSNRSEGEGSESGDLKEREYRDSHGNIHHHTHTSKEERDR